MANESLGREIWSDDLQAGLRRVGERYDGKYAMEPVYRFEIALDGHPELLAAEAVVSDFTGVAISKAAEKAGIKKHYGLEYSEYRNQQVRENGFWRYCKEMSIPWRDLSASEIMKVRTAFARLFFDRDCLWYEPMKGNPLVPPRVGPYRLVHLYFAPGGLPSEFHAVISTRDVPS